MPDGFLYQYGGIDRKLYKYYGNLKYAASCIEEKQIYMSDPNTFNDPFDSLYIPRSYDTIIEFQNKETVCRDIIDSLESINNNKEQKLVNEIIAHLKSRLVDYKRESKKNSVRIILIDIYFELKSAVNIEQMSFNEFCKLINKGYKNRKKGEQLVHKVSCFSEINDSVLMWSYYANSHKGVCVEFDFQKLDDKIEQNKRIKGAVAKVQYSPLRVDRTQESTFSENRSVFSKASMWAHEHEWRIAYSGDREYLPLDCVSAVYLGLRFEEGLKIDKGNTYKYLIKLLLSNTKLKVYMAYMAEDTYGIKFRKIKKEDVEKMLAN